MNDQHDHDRMADDGCPHDPAPLDEPRESAPTSARLWVWPNVPCGL